MREIEVKAKIRDKKKLFEKAAVLGIAFREPIVQDDITYETAMPKDDPSWNIFRIRRQNDATILTMKYKASSNSRDNYERESKIEDANEIAHMLERLGYAHGVPIKKTRQIAKYNQLEICIDEVDGLGIFIEVEQLTNDDVDGDEIQKNLWNFLMQFGVVDEDRVYKGYDTLMHELLDAKNSSKQQFH